MEYIVSAKEMKTADRNTSEIYGLSPEVLMERAALAVADFLSQEWKDKAAAAGRDTPCVLVFAGSGGNGGDGIAVARILHQRGARVLLVTVGEIGKYHEIAQKQLDTAMRYDVPMICLRQAKETEAVRMLTERRFDYLVDALFGIGLTRPLTGVHSAAVALINSLRETERDSLLVVSIDLPSGINTDTGEICGIAVQADVTITMNYKKRGMVLFPGAKAAGRIVTADVGITPESFQDEKPELVAFTEEPGKLLPPRPDASHKGSFGKLLIIAGNGSIGGAAILSARGALSAGVGMVRVFTEKKNRTALLQALPEALIDTWDEALPAERMDDTLDAAISWANACVIGPGIGTGESARRMLMRVLSENRLPLVIDADGCNLIAADPSVREAVKAYRPMEGWPVLTPHRGEFARLTGIRAAEGESVILSAPLKLARELSCTVLCKDARSVTARADCTQQVINLSGNNGMATAGSGDVLAGIVGALAAQGMNSMEAASVGSHLHGLAGDRAAARFGKAAMTAGDIVTGLKEIGI
ncbi:MAG: NAD(P)H-hydrate dehydratase [Lachnospiraceae bacterium]|nr:NAD(P)H-hydrate dehydratase [Lachnospiraceae bacterium]